MSLSTLFELQRKFQKRLGNDLASTQYIKDQSLALMVELSEFLQETNWKPWKKDKNLDYEKINEELIDCWHFLINLTLPFMSSEKVMMEFKNKHRKNNERQDNGY